MSKKRAAAGMLACLLAVGCYPPARPSYQLVRPEPAPSTPGTEAAPATPAPPAADNQDVELVSHVVQGYIAQIDTIEQRSRRSLAQDLPAPSPPPESQPASPVREDPAFTPLPQTGPEQAQQAPSAPDAPQESSTTAAPVAAPPLLPPPILASVSVQPLPPVSSPAEGGPPAEPIAGINRPVAAQGPPISLPELLRRWPGQAEDAGFREQLDLRILRVVAGDLEGARQPLSLVSAPQQELARCLIESLIAARQVNDGDPAATASRALSELDSLDSSLRRLGELQIPTIALCHEVTGFGQYRPVDPPRFPSGLDSEFVVYCELRGFVSERRADDLYHACFEMRTVVLDDSGQTVLEMRDPDIEDRCRQPRRDCFLPRLVRLPATLRPLSLIHI